MHIIKKGPDIYNAIDKSSGLFQCIYERKLVQNDKQLLKIKINILCQVVICTALHWMCVICLIMYGLLKWFGSKGSKQHRKSC